LSARPNLIGCVGARSVSAISFQNTQTSTINKHPIGIPTQTKQIGTRKSNPTLLIKTTVPLKSIH
jgi:hypothetical protein